MMQKTAYPFLESIRLKDGRFALLPFHEARMKATLHKHFGISLHYRLEDYLGRFSFPEKGLYKCRLLYGKAWGEPEFVPYRLKHIHSLKIVHADTLEYSSKYADRSALQDLLTKKGRADDILIIKHGSITDTSYCNIVFRRKQEWFTPENPLLEGVQRAFLLQQGIIQKAHISLEDLPSFSHFRLINAMIPWEESTDISLQNIG